MRLLRNYLEKILLVLILIILWMLLCGVLIEKTIKRKNMPLKEKKDLVLPILIMACNELFINRSIDGLARYRWNKDIFPIILTMDCDSNETQKIIKFYTDSDPTITYIVMPKLYPGLGRHYKFALNHVFKTLQYKAVIVLDDDLDISPDFYEYFLATYRLLERDPSILCVSAWNDNCKEGLVEENQVAMLHRTDYFPGKGWMIRSKTWTEIEPYLPESFSDDLMNNAVITRDRVCIRPEISRTFKFGGLVSRDGKTHDRHLNSEQRILNSHFVQFTQHDLSYLLVEHEHLFVSFVYSCPETTVEDVMSGLDKSKKFVRIPYSNVGMFRELAKMLGLMDDFDHGVVRTALHGIVQCFIKGRRVFLAPTRVDAFKLTQKIHLV